ncbi:hypothetical protein G7Y89_g6862 [Cudoniella acicularis]|uniref:Uncharacterized protein n=1 Tax=Cudoniella acicularis TaxID=354080 RepID=A0A8H4RLG3_9HELO|nr:hypothetical protein G7Y89_g6862 [Cudoniella acicularis]
MRFTSLFAAAGLLASVAVADPVVARAPDAVLPRQNAAQTTSFVVAQLSYLASLETDAGLSSLDNLLATNTAVLNSASSWLSSVASVVSKGGVVQATAVQALPTQVQSVYGSILSVQQSIATANGFTLTTTGVIAAAAPTGLSLKAAGAAAAGFVGLAMAL